MSRYREDWRDGEDHRGYRDFRKVHPKGIYVFKKTNKAVLSLNIDMWEFIKWMKDNNIRKSNGRRWVELDIVVNEDYDRIELVADTKKYYIVGGELQSKSERIAQYKMERGKREWQKKKQLEEWLKKKRGNQDNNPES